MYLGGLRITGRAAGLSIQVCCNKSRNLKSKLLSLNLMFHLLAGIPYYSETEEEENIG